MVSVANKRDLDYSGKGLIQLNILHGGYCLPLNTTFITTSLERVSSIFVFEIGIGMATVTEITRSENDNDNGHKTSNDDTSNTASTEFILAGGALWNVLQRLAPGHRTAGLIQTISFLSFGHSLNWVGKRDIVENTLPSKEIDRVVIRRSHKAEEVSGNA